MRHGFFIFLILLGYAVPCFAQDTLPQAEELYRQGRLSMALSLYEKALKNHPNDPFVYYNIGNCYFKMGSKGLAAANYYRAFKLNPRDPDIRHNLSLTLASGGERLVPTGVPEVLHRAFFSLSLPELTGLLFALFWLVCLYVCLWLLKRRGRWVLLITGSLLVICAGWWYARTEQDNQPLAVVATPVAEIRSGPGTNFPASASIAQGHLLTIEDEKDDWYEVIVKSQSLKGWVEKSTVEKI